MRLLSTQYSKLKNLSLIFFITLILFLLLNVFIVFAWPIYNNLNSKKHSYTNEQVNLLNLSNEDLVILNNESWRNYDKFRFVPFTGHSEMNRVGKFVNFTEENGRKVNRPSFCDKNIYLYGGSTTFGYNVTDYQTIGHYLQEMLGNTSCVFNHGRAYYYSKQENNLFINHLENKKKIDYAIFLDGVNERCGGYEYMRQINNSFSLLVERPFLMWKISFKNFLLTLPIVQFSNSLFGSNRWVQDVNNNILKIDSCDSKIGLNKLYESRLSIREAICKKYNINCHSFLQPMAGVHGVQIDSLLSKKRKKMFIKKYNILSDAKGYQNLGYVLDNDTSLSYVDGVHYSPQSNKKIALEFYKFLN